AGATRNETPDASRIAPAVIATRSTVRVLMTRTVRAVRSLARMPEDPERHEPGSALERGDEQWVVEQLVAVGYTPAEARRIAAEPARERAVGTHELFGSARLSPEEFAARVGLTLDQLTAVRVATGVAPRDQAGHDVVFGERDEPAFVAFALGTQLFGE